MNGKTPIYRAVVAKTGCCKYSAWSVSVYVIRNGRYKCLYRAGSGTAGDGASWSFTALAARRAAAKLAKNKGRSGYWMSGVGGLHNKKFDKTDELYRGDKIGDLVRGREPEII